jgi:hypothetical protein
MTRSLARSAMMCADRLVSSAASGVHWRHRLSARAAAALATQEAQQKFRMLSLTSLCAYACTEGKRGREILTVAIEEKRVADRGGTSHGNVEKYVDGGRCVFWWRRPAAGRGGEATAFGKPAAPALGCGCLVFVVACVLLVASAIGMY